MPEASGSIILSGHAPPGTLVQVEVDGQKSPRFERQGHAHGAFAIPLDVGPGTTRVRVLTWRKGSPLRFTTLKVTRPVIQTVPPGSAVTSNTAITGTISDTRPVTVLLAGLDQTPAANYVNVSGDLEAGNRFALDGAELSTVNGGPLAAGEHVLHLEAVDADGGSTVATTSFVFAAPPALSR